MTLCHFHKPATLNLSRRDKLRTTLHPEETKGQCQCPSRWKEFFIFVSKHIQSHYIMEMEWFDDSCLDQSVMHYLWGKAKAKRATVSMGFLRITRIKITALLFKLFSFFWDTAKHQFSSWWSVTRQWKESYGSHILNTQCTVEYAAYRWTETNQLFCLYLPKWKENESHQALIYHV